ncbi:MAG: hypothetical protein OES12_05115 [Anaerolineae bacterium]|nr:hypothetical protein [Anaerolineae bacterium]
MTTYVEVSRALVRAGYLSEADVDAAAKVLAHALTTADANKKKAAALDDEAHQHDMIAQAADLITDDEAISDYQDEGVQVQTIEAAEKQLAADEAVIAGICSEAAAALLQAGLIEAANVDAAAGVIKKVV